LVEFSNRLLVNIKLVRLNAIAVVAFTLVEKLVAGLAVERAIVGFMVVGTIVVGMTVVGAIVVGMTVVGAIVVGITVVNKTGESTFNRI
jgi:hypothetical protein